MATLNLTARELEILKAVGRYINTAAVDWTVLAPELGFPTPKRCRDSWYPIRNKLFGAGGDAPGTPSNSAKKKKDALKRKSVGEEATPVKKKGKKSVEQDEEDDEEDKSFIKIEPRAEAEAEDDFGELV